jgi:iron complex outermembrane receptor protein
MKQSNRITLFTRTLTVLLIFGMAMVWDTAMGQETKKDQPQEEFVLEEIVITGSRIVRRDFEAVSPIVTVGEELFDQSSTLAIETQLNKLPQFVPTIDVPTSGGDIQPTARNTPGEATVALRGIGMNRTLVLINGRRGTPSNGAGYLDINTIPIAAIERVEAISGGASSTYGADAMAGVLNFIMKKNFVGLEIDAQAGITQEGDNFEWQTSGVMGSDFADDRGNVMMAFSYNRRGDALQKDRSWYRDNWMNPAIGGTQFFPPYTGANLGTTSGGNLPTLDAINTAMGLTGADAFTSVPSGVTYYVYGTGKTAQVFTGFDANSQPGIAAAEDLGVVDGYTVKLQNSGLLGQNNVTNYLIFPMTRYNIYTSGNYKVNDWFGVFMQGYFSKVATKTVQEPGIITSGWSVNIYPDYNRDVIPDDLLTILDSRPNPHASFSIRSLLPMNRRTLTETTTYNIVLGLEGKIPTIDWTWELFHSHGEAETYAQSVGYASLERTRIVMGGYVRQYQVDDATGAIITDFFGNPTYQDVIIPGYKNFGEGFVMKANGMGSPDGGFGAATAYCTSGLNPFDWSSMTADCWEAIKADVKTRMLMVQDIYEANLQGHIIDLPAGEMRGAIGVSERQQNFKFLSDTINSEGVSFTDQILGLYPAQDSLGSIEVKEEYAELLVPVLKDIPFIKNFNLELGGRRSDYDTTGVSYTYKALGDLRMRDWLRFRGGYNRAERAPNIAELYLNPEQTFGMMSYGDVCSMRNSVAPITANPAKNPDWYKVVKLCGQLMDKAGTDLDVTWFYGGTWESIYQYGVDHPNDHDATTVTNMETAGLFTDFYYSSFLQSAGGFGFLWPINVGNDNLKPEIADTWTIGVVIDSPFQQKALSNWRVSLDYYIIKISDAIGEQSADVVMYQCVNPAYNPTYDPESPYCQGFLRDARFGSLGQVRKTFYNNGRFQTSGIDINLNWSMDLGPGQIMVNSNINWLLDKTSTELLDWAAVDYTGTYGPTGNGLNGNSFKWRAMTTVGYTWGDVNLSIRWQYWDAIQQAAYASGSTIMAGAPVYHMFDLLGNYALTERLRLRFGVENVLNIKPDLTGYYYSSPSGMTGGSFNYNQDTNGRRFYMGMRWEL